MNEPNVKFLPAAPILLELHSERFFELIRALAEQGFQLSNCRGKVNRFRIEDKNSEVLS